MSRTHHSTLARAAVQSHLPFAAAALGVALLAVPAVSVAQEGQRTAPTLPDTAAVTAATIDAGRAVFHGAGQCAVCHGASLEGGVGPTLKAHEWKDAPHGDLAAIYRVIVNGVPGTAMVGHPGGISDDDAAKVAAYVWAVGRGKARP